MAWTTNNLGGQRSATSTIREDLSNVISNITRDETPLLSSIGTNKATGPRHEWLTDTYAVPTSNRQAEGFSFDGQGTSSNNDGANTAAARQSNRTKINNFTQIFGKKIVASGSTISSDTAGVANEYAYQLKKAGVENRRDIEYQYLRWNEATSADANDVTRIAATGTAGGQLGSVFSYAAHWLNATSAVGLRAVPVSESGVVGTVPAAGTNADGADLFNQELNGGSVVQFDATVSASRVSIARSHFEDLITAMYASGGKPNVAMIPVGLRTQVSAMFVDGNTTSGGAERRIDAMMKKLNISIMGVTADFGVDLALVHNYIMDGPGNSAGSGADNTVMLYDSSMLKRSILTPMTTEEDRQARYGRAGIIYCEETLEVMNPNSVGVIVGVNAG